MAAGQYKGVWQVSAWWSQSGLEGAPAMAPTTLSFKAKDKNNSDEEEVGVMPLRA